MHDDDCMHRWSAWYDQEDSVYRWMERVCLHCGALETRNFTTKK